MADNKDRKSSVIPGTPDYYGTGGEIKGWLDQNIGTYLESNPGLINVKSIQGGQMGGLVPAGASIMYGGDTAPAGWVLEDGSTYDAVANPTLYLNLYTAIGIKYGGTGQADFKVPDSRGRTGVGLGTHAAVSTLGNTEGNLVANRAGLKHNTLNSLSVSIGSLAISGGPYVATPGTVTSPGAGAGIVVGNTSSSPTLTGDPALGGTVGANSAGLPSDGGAYIVKNWIMKL